MKFKNFLLKSLQVNLKYYSHPLILKLLVLTQNNSVIRLSKNLAIKMPAICFMKKYPLTKVRNKNSGQHKILKIFMKKH